MAPAASSSAMRKHISPIRDTSVQDRALDERVPRARRRRLWLIAAGGALVALVAITLLLRAWLSAEVTVSRGRVRIAEVKRGLFVRDVSAQGTVVAAVSPTLFAPAPGTVHFLVQAGDEVRRDQIVATLDSPELRSELKQQEATLSNLEVAVSRQRIESRQQLLSFEQARDLAGVALRAAEREQRRAEDSKRQQLISERDYERAGDDLAAARVTYKHAMDTAELQKEQREFEMRARQIELARQRVVVEELRRRVAGLEVRSPVNGMVGALAVDERAAVPLNAPLLSVIDLSAFEVEFLIPESYADDVGIGMPAEVTYGGRVFAARVSAVSPEVQRNQVRGRLRFTAEAPRGLRQNQRLATRILLDSREGVLKVARGAFLDELGGRAAYVLRGDIASRERIKSGATSVSEVEILAGLAPGDRIIISDLGELAGAATIRIVD